MPTKTRPAAVYWDSCVFIAAIQREPDRIAILDSIIAEAKAGKVILVASVLVRTEVAKLNKSSDCLTEQVRKIREFFENDFIELRDVTEEITECAADILRDHDVKPMDALHLATALQLPCKAFHTYDGTTRKNKRTKPYLLDLNGKIGRPPLTIIQPELPGGPQLFPP